MLTVTAHYTNCDYRIHDSGCGDIDKESHRPGWESAGPYSCVPDLLKTELDAIIDEDMAAYEWSENEALLSNLGQFTICPCAAAEIKVWKDSL